MECNVMRDDVGQSFYVSISVALLFLLLIPVFNILSLNSGKIMDQIQELSIKRAYGATKSDILRGVLFESIILTIAGALIGLLLDYPTLYLVNYFIHSLNGSTVSLEIHLDLYIFAGIFAIALIFSILSSYFPALKVANSNITLELKGGNNE